MESLSMLGLRLFLKQRCFLLLSFTVGVILTLLAYQFTRYVPWNLPWNEPERGVFNFKDNLDLEAYLQLAASLGLWMILRPGPYICAEWDLRGLPSTPRVAQLLQFIADEEYMPFIKEALLSRGVTELLLTSDNQEGLKCGGVKGGSLV